MREYGKIVRVRRLTEDELRATMGPEPRRVDMDEVPPVDFWPYFDGLPRSEWDGHDFSSGRVNTAWAMPGKAWQHVLIASEDTNVYLALVLDLNRATVHGHHVLNLNRLYGLEDR